MTSTNAAPVQLGTGIDAIWQTVTCRANQKSSPLLRLPAELRNKIYKYALSDWVVSLSYTNDDPICGRKIVLCTRAGLDDNVWYAATCAILGLRSTCRQLREETGILPYTLNNRFSWDDEWSKHELLNPIGNERPRYEKTWKRTMGAEDWHDMENTRPGVQFSCVRDLLKAYRNEFRGFGGNGDGLDDILKGIEALHMPPA